MSTVIDRCCVNTSRAVLARRDAVLNHVDPLVTPPQLTVLRSASLMGNTLFSGEVSKVIPSLKEARKEKTAETSVAALISLAKSTVKVQNIPQKKKSKAPKQSNTPATPQSAQA